MEAATQTMKHQTLGPSFQSFGPNFRIAIVVSGVGVLFSWLAYVTALEMRGAVAWMIFYFLAVGFGLLIARHLVFRVWVHETGISYRGLLGYEELPWRELERVYFGSYDINVHHIPLGTFYRLRLITKRGKKLSIGERLHAADDLMELIKSYTLKEMLRQAMHEFWAGVAVDFGAVRVHRVDGLKVRKWFQWVTIRWEELADYNISSDRTGFGRWNKRFVLRINSERIANIHVLESLLDEARREFKKKESFAAR